MLELLPWLLFLAFVGGKMLLVDVYKIPALVSLGVIVAILTFAFVASFYAKRRGTDDHDGGRPADPATSPGLPAASLS